MFRPSGLLLLLLGLSYYFWTTTSIKPMSLIRQCVWGKISVVHPDGSFHEYRDAKIWPEGSSAWDWKETGTRHDPGVQISDLGGLVDKADIIILTRGVNGVLLVSNSTANYLLALNKRVEVLLTPDAHVLYNELVGEGKRVAGLFHTTC